MIAARRIRSCASPTCSAPQDCTPIKSRISPPPQDSVIAAKSKASGTGLDTAREVGLAVRREMAALPAPPLGAHTDANDKIGSSLNRSAFGIGIETDPCIDARRQRMRLIHHTLGSRERRQVSRRRFNLSGRPARIAGSRRPLSTGLFRLFDQRGDDQRRLRASHNPDQLWQGPALSPGRAAPIPARPAPAFCFRQGCNWRSPDQTAQAPRLAPRAPCGWRRRRLCISPGRRSGCSREDPLYSCWLASEKLSRDGATAAKLVMRRLSGEHPLGVRSRFSPEHDLFKFARSCRFVPMRCWRAYPLLLAAAVSGPMPEPGCFAYRQDPAAAPSSGLFQRAMGALDARGRSADVRHPSVISAQTYFAGKMSGCFSATRRCCGAIRRPNSATCLMSG